MTTEPTSTHDAGADPRWDELVAAHRGELVGLAYRMLGSVAEAEDAVQEAFARLAQRGLDGLERPGGWLARTTGRICLDRLKSARARRERYPGPWLPEPRTGADDDPAEAGELAESVSMALLLVLETLGPAERVALVLHDVFGCGHDEVAAALDRSEAACRQLVSRARGHVAARRPRFEPDRTQRDATVRRFLDACRTGELEPLLAVLAPDVELRADGGGVVSAARNPVHGADAVARFVLGLWRKAPEDAWLEPTPINATLGVIARRGDGAVDTVLAFDVHAGAIRAIYTVRNPHKLAHITPAW